MHFPNYNFLHAGHVKCNLCHGLFLQFPISESKHVERQNCGLLNKLDGLISLAQI